MSGTSKAKVDLQTRDDESSTYQFTWKPQHFSRQKGGRLNPWFPLRDHHGIITSALQLRSFWTQPWQSYPIPIYDGDDLAIHHFSTGHPGHQSLDPNRYEGRLGKDRLVGKIYRNPWVLPMEIQGKNCQCSQKMFRHTNPLKEALVAVINL